MDVLRSLVQPLVGGAGGSSVIDGVKLVVLGGTVETARRVSSSAWSHFVNSFFLTAHFSEEDYPYDWLMLWLSRRPEWQRSREFETTTRNSTPGVSNSRIFDNSFGDEEGDNLLGKPATRVVFQPTPDTTHTIYYRGHWLRVRRSKKTDGSGCEVLSISVVARNNTILKHLVLEAKREYEAEAVHRVQIYFADSHGSWRWTDSRHKRPMSSIVLNPGVKEMLLNDTRDFLKSEKWYADRGIPFRRGYLLHGVPGSGKSSLIHAIAGELMLDIYVVSLSSSWISDSTLTTLMGRVPARCVVLLEDLDAAFTRSVTRDKTSNGTPESSASSSTDDVNNEQAPSVPSSNRHRRHKDQLSDVNTLSLSGLLNALDGVAAAEGRILFATTNHLERLDPALSRPGRMDVWIEFKNASKWQAEALFRNFFPSAESEEVVDRELEGIEFPTTPSSQSQSQSPSARSSTLWSRSPSFSSSSTSLASSPRSVPAEYVASLDNFEIKEQGCYGPPVEEHLPTNTAKALTATELAQLAKQFADAIPEEEFSVAALQGYLLKNKSQPEGAAFGAADWVRSEIELKHRLQKEKEVREGLEREKRRKESATKDNKAELEKKDLELTQLRQQLQEHETRTKSSGETHAALVSAPAPEPPNEGSTDDHASAEENDGENVPPESNPSIAWH